MSHIDVRDENGIRIIKFGNMAGMRVIDGMPGRWTTVGKFSKPAFVLDTDMKITLGHDSSEMIVFFYKGTKFILEGE